MERWPRRLAGLALLALVAWGGFLRFADLAGPSFWIDEAFSVASARAILRHGYPLLPTGEVYTSYLPAHLLMALGLAVFPDPHAGARVFSALAGTLLLAVFYAFNRRLFGSRSQALLATALLAFLGWEIAWCRQARAYALVQLLIYSGIVLWLRFLERRGTGALLGALALMALAAATHRAGHLAWVFALISGAWAWSGNRQAWRQWARERARGLAPALALAGLAFLAVAAGAGNSAWGQTLGGVLEGSDHLYAAAYGTFLWELLGWLLVWAAAGAVLAAALAPARLIPLLGAAALFLAVLGFRTRLFHLRYLLPILPLIPAFAAAGLAACWGLAGRWRPGWRRAAGRAALLALFAASVPWGALTLTPRTYYLGWTAPQPDWRRACRWVAEDFRRSAQPGRPLAFISAFPVMADLYLTNHPVRKIYLPCSLSGSPGDFQQTAGYTEAETLADPAALRDSGGYIVLDALGLERLQNQDLARYLRRLTPTYTVEGPFPLRVWKVQPIGR